MNPLNPRNEPVIDEQEDAARDLRETVGHCERLLASADFAWFWNTILLPPLQKARTDSENADLRGKEIRQALRLFKILQHIHAYPVEHVTAGRKSLAAYEQAKMREAHPAPSNPAEPKLKPGFQE